MSACPLFAVAAVVSSTPIPLLPLAVWLALAGVWLWWLFRLIGMPGVKARPPAMEAARLWLRGLLMLLVAGAVLSLYARNQFRGLIHAEAMDQAQIARNLSRGDGYTTRSIRPLSFWKLGYPAAGSLHPDISHPPLYPALAAGVLAWSQPDQHQPAGALSVPRRSTPARIIVWRHWAWVALVVLAGWLAFVVRRPWRRNAGPVAVQWHLTGTLACLTVAGLSLARPTLLSMDPIGDPTLFGPDRWLIYGLGLPLTLLCGLLTYAIGRRLFDRPVAVIAAGILVLSQSTCHYAISGLSVTLTSAWVAAACLCMVIAGEWQEQQRPARGARLLWLLAGALIGAAFLSRYAAGWLLLPACALCWWSRGLRRGWVIALGMAAVFLAVAAPWLARNYCVSGSALGLAALGAWEHTRGLPGDLLQRALELNVRGLGWPALAAKAIRNASAYWTTPSWAFGAGVAWAVFLGALFYTFKRPLPNRFKWFATWSFVLLFAVMCVAGARPRPAQTLADVGNLMTLLMPLVAAYAAGMFRTWLGWLNIQRSLAGAAVVTLFVGAFAFPVLPRLVRPAADCAAYPPYHPPTLARLAAYLGPEEFMMSDQPSAVAWYGDRHCVWMPATVNGFYKFHRERHPIAALLLTPVTLNARFLTEIMHGEWADWWPILSYLRFPDNFPLRAGNVIVGRNMASVPWDLTKPLDLDAVSGGVHMILLCDRQRWPEAKPASTRP